MYFVGGQLAFGKSILIFAEDAISPIQEAAMRAFTITIPCSSKGVSQLPALVVEPDSGQAADSVLLFLHDKGEAGSSLSELPLVCVHQTPPFQALLGRLPETLVIAPQAPPIPTVDDWNWHEHVKALAEFLVDRYAERRAIATGFSRGGLRYGSFRHRNETWESFSSLLSDRLPEATRDTAELQHVEIAAQAYCGSLLSSGTGKKNPYDFLGLKFSGQ
jgi:hypothetical protein